MYLSKETIDMVYEELEKATGNYQVVSKVLADATDRKDRAFQMALASGEVEGKNDDIRQGLFEKLHPDLVADVWMATQSEIDAANYLALVKIRVEKLRMIMRFEELVKPS